jgi:hypothetical protein
MKKNITVMNKEKIKEIIKRENSFWFELSKLKAKFLKKAISELFFSDWNGES